METFKQKAHVINECLHEYGIHSATLQPEAAPPASSPTIVAAATATTDGAASSVSSASLGRRRRDPDCQIICSSVCQKLACCAKIDT